jgi:U3 small nucleolar RNA-associated protein 22
VFAWFCFPELLVQKARLTLQPELLVGFDPALRLVEELRGRYGHVAEFCLGGALERLVGIKWRPQAFVPGPLRVPTAHCMLPRVVAGEGGGVGNGAIVDSSSVLSELMDIGEGLVSDIVLLDSSILL